MFKLCRLKQKHSFMKNNLFFTKLDSLYLIKNRCVFECPIQTFPDEESKRCIDCLAGCKQCTSKDQCLENVQIFPCGKGEFYSVFTENCQTCTISFCEVCNQYSVCTKCQANTFLQDSICVLGCSQGFYGNISTWSCEKCDVLCQICSENSKNCSHCSQLGWQSALGICTSDCPSKTFKQYETRSCLNCSSSCDSCTDGEICLQCSDGFYLVNRATCTNDCDLHGLEPNLLSGTCQSKIRIQVFTISQMENFDEFNIYFTEPIKLLTQNPSSEDMLKIFSFNIPEIQVESYKISLKIDAANEIRVSISRQNQYVVGVVEIQILDFTKLYSMDGLKTIDSNKKLQAIMYGKQNLESYRSNLNTAQSTFGIISYVFFFIFLVGFTDSSSQFMENIQLVEFLNYLQFSYPAKLEIIYIALKYFQNDFIPKLGAKSFAGGQSTPPYHSYLDHQIVDQQIDPLLESRTGLSSSFMLNGFSFLLMNLSSWLVFFVLSQFKKDTLAGSLKYQILINTHLSNLLPLVIAINIQFQNYSEVDYFNVLSFLIAVASLIYLSLFLMNYYKILLQLFQQTSSTPIIKNNDLGLESLTSIPKIISDQDQQFKMEMNRVNQPIETPAKPSNYAFLIEEFVQNTENTQFLCIFYNVIRVITRLIVITCTFLFFENPALNLGLLVFYSILEFVFILKFRPFRRKFLFFQTILNSLQTIVILIFNLLVLTYQKQLNSQTEQADIMKLFNSMTMSAQITFILILILISSNIIMILGDIILISIDKYQTHKSKSQIFPKVLQSDNIYNFEEFVNTPNSAQRIQTPSS